MKFGWALGIAAAAAACNGGGHGAVLDAGLDADADVDAAPDADPMADSDGDGVLDSADVCPMIADPAQVDLDGDHIGWMCDPVESTTVPVIGGVSFMPLAVRENTIGIEMASACVNGVCTHASLAVGPGGISRADGVADAWLNGFPLRGFVGAENHVVWSMADGVIGDQDASTDAFTPRTMGTILGFNANGVARYERGDLLVLSSEPRNSSVDSYALLAPLANGNVVSIAASSSAFLKPTIVGTSPARLVFGVSDPANRSLNELVAGSSSSQPVVVGGTPLSNADVVVPLSRTSLGGMFGFCVDKGGKRYIVETIDDQLRGYEVPISSCSISVQQTTDHQLTLISGVDTACIVLNGVVHPIAISVYLELLGTGVPAIITKRTGPRDDVYVVDAAGVLHAVTSDGVASNVASEGDTIHFLSIHGDTEVLARYRNGITTEVPLPAITTGESWRVFTTKEGAALVSTTSTAMVWPSQSSVAVQIDFDNIDGLVRNGATFFIASHNDIRSQPALYSYAEVGGMPQYTALTPEVLQNVSFRMMLYPLGYSLPVPRDLPRTDWFIYTKDGDCRMVWPIVTGTTVTLLGNVSCAGGAGIRGVTPAGVPVVDVAGSASPQQLYLLDGSTLTKIAEGRSMQFLYATPESPLLLGWTGLDVFGAGFLCSASHPDRCWATPNDPSIWGPIVPAQPDGLHVLFVKNQPGGMSFTSIRTFGPGNRAQPL
jgi:hypothetical protein